nr:MULTISPECIES: tetratricopeptide repeat protein [unclassified Dyella]
MYLAGYELDRERGELRGPDGEAIKLRSKSFDMLWLFATRAGRVLGKQELIETIWPNVHISENGLFQCIREIRSALGDDRHELLRLLPGRGYVLDAEVTHGLERIAAGRESAASALTIAVRPMKVSADAAPSLEAATKVCERLADGLARIERIRVITLAQDADADPRADFVVSGELHKSGAAWEAHARMTSTATGEVRWSGSVTVSTEAGDTALQRSRLVAGLGHPLALRINALQNCGAWMQGGGEDELPAAYAKVVIEQATAIINQTTRERFQVAQEMLEKALADHPDDVDLLAALAGHLLRGTQTAWYDPADTDSVHERARALLERAMQAKPHYIPVLEAYCRLLTMAGQLPETLIACGRMLSFDPWHGIALFHLGIAQTRQGRFEEALATFKQADTFDTPAFARWTWLLGVGMAYTLLERYAEALPWLERSLAVTPGTGRTHFALAVGYQQLGRDEDARVAFSKGLELRPGSNAGNVQLPRKHGSPVFLAASDRYVQVLSQLGLPAE